MTSRLRGLALPVLAVLLVAVVLGVQSARGGGDFRPMRLPDPCVSSADPSTPRTIESLTERLVMRGVARAACTLGVARETLVLDLARHADQPPEPGVTKALRHGLLDAVAGMKKDGTLPPISALKDEALDAADLNSWLDWALRRLPDSVVDGALKTDDVLRRAIDGLDLAQILSRLDDPNALAALVNPAITKAVKDSLTQRLRDLV